MTLIIIKGEEKIKKWYISHFINKDEGILVISFFLTSQTNSQRKMDQTHYGCFISGQDPGFLKLLD